MIRPRPPVPAPPLNPPPYHHPHQTTQQPILGTTRVERIHSQSGPALALPFTDKDFEALTSAIAK